MYKEVFLKNKTLKHFVMILNLPTVVLCTVFVLYFSAKILHINETFFIEFLFHRILLYRKCNLYIALKLYVCHD